MIWTSQKRNADLEKRLKSRLMAGRFRKIVLKIDLSNVKIRQLC